VRKAKPLPDGEPAATAATDTSKPVAIRAGTKQAQIIALLQRPESATIAEIVEATSWQAHTARGAISGALKKKLGLPVTSEMVDGRGMVYRITGCRFEPKAATLCRLPIEALGGSRDQDSR